MRFDGPSLILSLWVFWACHVGTVAAEPSPSPSSPTEVIPFNKNPTGMAELSLNSFLWLAIILGVAIASLYIIRRYFPNLIRANPQTRRVKLVEVTRIAPRAALLVVEYDNETLLLAQTEKQISLLLQKKHT
jgi:flagellar biogenesis protein FliO